MRAAHPPPSPAAIFLYIRSNFPRAADISPDIYIGVYSYIYDSLSYISENAFVYIVKQPSYISEKGRKHPSLAMITTSWFKLPIS
jgi:hypothetical protein